MSHWLRRALVLVLLALGLPSALAAVTPSRTIHESFTTNTCLPSSVTLIQQHAPTVEATLCDDPDSGSWEVVPASELAAGPSSSDDATLDLVLLAGWPKGGQVRITLRPALVDGFGRALQIPAGEHPSGVRVTVRIPPTDEPPALDRRWPLRFDSGHAAANTLGGAFPGGQTSLFQGLWTDPVSGLAYARARWYDTRTASWLSEDPVGTFDSPNLYAFVAWQPHMYRDPSGESLWTAYRTGKEAIGSVLANPRVQGAMQIVQGAMEIAIGAAGAKTGLGLMAVAHGSDTSAAGLVALITGEAQITVTHRAARDIALLAGANEGVAEQVGFWTDMAVGTAASIGAARARAARAPPGVGGAAGNAPKSEVKWTVGEYRNLLAKSEPGLHAHHVGQKALMKKFVPGYDPATGPSVLVPKVGHTLRGPRGIVSRSMKDLTSGRAVIARDIAELRRVYPEIPRAALREVIELNKKMYPILRVRVKP